MGQDNTFKDQFYLVLAGIFISSLVTCNMIANKFVTVDLGFKVFIVSAGILLGNPRWLSTYMNVSVMTASASPKLRAVARLVGQMVPGLRNGCSTR